MPASMLLMPPPAQATRLRAVRQPARHLARQAQASACAAALEDSLPASPQPFACRARLRLSAYRRAALSRSAIAPRTIATLAARILPGYLRQRNSSPGSSPACVKVAYGSAQHTLSLLRMRTQVQLRTIRIQLCGYERTGTAPCGGRACCVVAGTLWTGGI